MRTSTILTCALALAMNNGAHAQAIPNGGFESWTNTGGGYSEPDGWITANMVTYSIGSLLACEQGSPGAVGAYFAKVTDRDLTPFGFGMQQGSVTAGTLSVNAWPGFPCSGRPDALNGQWQYFPQLGGYNGSVGASLTRWNTMTQQREVVGNCLITTSGPITSWTDFSATFLYYSAAIPDSAHIFIQTSTMVAGDGTAIWVDDLNFSTAQGVHEQAAANAFDLYPSPATDLLSISATEPLAEVVLQDLSGRALSRTVQNSLVATVNVAELPAGIYLVLVRFADGKMATRRFMKN